MNKLEAIVSLKTLSSGTIASLTGVRTYKEIDEILDARIAKINEVDVSPCQSWQDVWNLVNNKL